MNLVNIRNNWRSSPSNVTRLHHTTHFRGPKKEYASSTRSPQRSVPTDSTQGLQSRSVSLILGNCSRFLNSASPLSLLSKIYYNLNFNHLLLHPPWHIVRTIDPIRKIDRRKRSSSSHLQASHPESNAQVIITDLVNFHKALTKLFNDGIHTHRQLS